jgi:gamma-glutamyltranspeptidase/glutathione hydrolase
MVVSARGGSLRLVTFTKKKGNAFDAMVATELALAFLPSSRKYDGGGFMVFRKPMVKLAR